VSKRTSLLINTATIVGVAGIARESQIVAEVPLQLAVSSNAAVAAIDQVLADSGSSIGDVQEIVLVRGPGTFTGSRVGASIAKAIAYVTSCSFISVTTLEAVAWSGLLKSAGHYQDGPVWALLDARRHELYVQRFALHGQQLDEESGAVCRGLDVLDEVARSGGIAACAFAASALPSNDVAAEHGRTTWLFDTYPTCAGILAASQSGRREDPFVFEPLYLRSLEELFDHPAVAP